MKETIAGGISRRTFLAGALLGAGSIASASALSACSTPKVKPDTANGERGNEIKSDSWYGNDPDIAETDIVETVDVDVLVIGNGSAGAFAAGAAAEAGAGKVLIIEKQSGLFGLRRGYAGVNSRASKAEGVSIDKADFMHDLNRYSCYDANIKLQNVWWERSGETMDWYDDVMREQGMELMCVSYTGSQDARFTCWPVAHTVLGETKEMTRNDAMQKHLEADGVEVRYSTAMVKIEKDNGEVTGVVATNESGAYIRINARKGVIVCTGGYASNVDMLRELQPNTLAMSAMGPNGAVHGLGDGVKAAVRAGAHMNNLHFSHTFPRAAIPADAIAGEDSLDLGVYFVLGSQPFMRVNLKGERFYNESSPYDFVNHAVIYEPGACSAMIWDSDWQNQVTQFETLGCSRISPMPDSRVGSVGFDGAQKQIDDLLENNYIQQADTPEELAEKLGIPNDAFAATFAHYNEMCAAGEDSDFGKEPFRMMALTNPPYYGVRMAGYPLATIDGIDTDEYGRALDSDRTPIDGLYVCGNDSHCFYGHGYPDLMGGMNASRCAVFGRIAGMHAAQRK